MKLTFSPCVLQKRRTHGSRSVRAMPPHARAHAHATDCFRCSGARISSHVVQKIEPLLVQADS